LIDEIVDWPDAVVIIKSKSNPLDIMVRGAVLVYRTPDGFAWVESGYLDPYGSPSPQFHRLVCEVRKVGSMYRFENESWRGRIERFRHSRSEWMTRAFADYAEHLVRSSRSRREEWLRLREELADSLA
jgi:hypothetical protein